MANRQQRRQMNKKSPLGDAIKNLAQQVQKSREDNEQQQEDLNILPFPASQKIHEDRIDWKWDSLVNSEFTVHATYYMDSGVYHVELQTGKPFPDDDTDRTGEVYCLSPDEPKVLGQALIAAWDWENRWQEHMGRLMLRDRAMGKMNQAAEAPEMSGSATDFGEPVFEPVVAENKTPEVPKSYTFEEPELPYSDYDIEHDDEIADDELDEG